MTNEENSEEQQGRSNKYQVSVLRYMSKTMENTGTRQFQIAELAELTGLRDEKEIQRSLYILEGHKFVSPCPEGDFTSKTWQITTDGVEAVKRIPSEASAVRL